MIRLCITGGGGRLAQALLTYFPYADAPGRDFLDVADAASCRRWFSSRTYDVVIHAAAATAHDATPATYQHHNVVGTSQVAHWARKQGARLVYTSTDYVYPAWISGPHQETDPVWPVNTYAWSKLGGEAVCQLYDQSLIVRGSWYGHLDQPSATTDGYTSKIPVARAAAWIAGLATSTATGIVNIGGARRSLWEIVVTEFNPNCRPISRSQVPVPYTIPMDSSVDTTRMRNLIGR